MTQIVVIAKEPLPGRAKTRLIPAYGELGAAALAQAALQDTLDAALGSRAERVVLALDGGTGPWLPPGIDVIQQHQGGLGARLCRAIADAYAGLPVPVLVIGMDTPQLTPALLDAAVAWLDSPCHQAVLGPADDGGYWCIGLRTPDARAFDGVPMSTDLTGAAQLRRLDELGLRTTMMPALRDVDLPADVEQVARVAPGTRFALLASSLGRAVA